MRGFVFFFIFLLSSHSVFGKVFTRCELAEELKRQGLPVEQLPDWVCLVENESSRDTSAIGGPNTNGSYDWGLFQINDGFWCIPGAVGGDCNITCQSVVTTDITVATTCAKFIYARHGFNAWNAWKAKCQEPTDLPDLSSCDI